MSVADTTTFIAKCTPYIRRDFGDCEGLTLANVSPTTSDELDSIYRDASHQFRHIGALLDFQMEGKMCGVKEITLSDFLIAYAEKLEKPLVRSSANSVYPEMEPFVMVRRKGVLNPNYWKFTNSSSTPGTSPTLSASYTHYVDVTSTSSIPADPDWFPAGLEIFISALSSGGSAVRSAWLVVDAVNQSATVCRVYLTSRNAATNLPAAKVQFTTTGIVFRGLNNVHPSEPWCKQIPALNTKQAYMAWLQFTQWSICNDEHNRMFKQRIYENNPLYRELIHVEPVEVNAQVYKDFKNRLAHAFLFSKPLANQTDTGWKNLTTISSTTLSTFSDVSARVVGRRANMVGVYEQLYECGRVLDLQGQRVNFVELQSFLYDLSRQREDNGGNGNLIEVVVDSAYRPQFIQALWRYLTGRYEGAIQATMQMPTDQKTNLGFVFRDFILDFPAGVTLRVVSHRSFDDLISAHRAASSSIAAAGRWMLMLDWSSIYLAVIESRTEERTSASAEEWAKFNSTAFCTMDIPQKSVKLYNAQIACVVDCPAASLWIENFSFDVPEHEMAVGATDAGGDWTANNTTTP